MQPNLCFARLVQLVGRECLEGSLFRVTELQLASRTFILLLVVVGFHGCIMEKSRIMIIMLLYSLNVLRNCHGHKACYCIGLNIEAYICILVRGL